MSVYPPVLLLVLLACATSDALSTATSDVLSTATNWTHRADDGTTGWIDLCAIGCCGEGMVEITYDAELAPTVGANKQYKFVTVGNSKIKLVKRYIFQCEYSKVNIISLILLTFYYAS